MKVGYEWDGSREYEFHWDKRMRWYVVVVSEDEADIMRRREKTQIKTQTSY